MQAEEFTAGVEEEYLMLMRDYLVDGTQRKATASLARFEGLSPEQLLEPAAIAGVLGLPAKADIEDMRLVARGYRLLRRVPPLPGTVINRLVDRFVTLQGLLVASEAELDDVDGVGARRARAIHDGLRRMREHAIG
jgi:diadenylate cyclase